MNIELILKKCIWEWLHFYFGDLFSFFALFCFSFLVCSLLWFYSFLLLLFCLLVFFLEGFVVGDFLGEEEGE